MKVLVFQLNHLIQYNKNGEWSIGKWKDYATRFNKEITTNPKSQTAITKLREMSKTGQHITLLCYCRDELYCHSSLVKDFVERQAVI